MTAVAIEVSQISRVHAALDGVSFEGLPAGVVKASLAELARARARIQALEVQAARQIRATGADLARGFGGDQRSGDVLVKTAEALESASATESALQAGRVSFDQARVIAGGLAKLPEETTVEQRGLAEQSLLKDAERMSLRDLRRRTDRVTDAFLPEPEVDAHENALLEERERRALKRASFRMWDNRDGSFSGDFTLPEAQAALLKHHVDQFAAPRRGHLQDIEVEDNRIGRGFAELCERLPETDPTGGPTVVVTMDHDVLAGKVQAASLSDGTKLSAGQARRLAARANLIPMVLGSDSVPLDLGTTQRLFTKHQRRAIEHRDRGCTFPGCERPPSWCEINHVIPWWNGGQTDLNNAALLCAHHHRYLDQGWSTRIRDGVPEYREPGSETWLRNRRSEPYHRSTA